MKTLLALCVFSVLVMHFNQDLNPVYWIGFITFAISALAATYKMDRREQFDKELGEEIENLKKKRYENS